MVDPINKNSLGKGAAYLYIEAITMIFSGYIYWLILSKITSPSVIGISSTVISLANIFIIIASVGVSGGINSFLGKSIAENKVQKIRGIINSSLLIVCLGISGSSITILILQEWIYNYFKIDILLIIILISIMGTSVIAFLLRAIIIPSMKINVITLSAIVSTIIKISITIILVLMSTGATGILIGFMLQPIISSIILSIAIKKTVYAELSSKDDKNSTINLFQSARDIFNASIAFWVPAIINTIGSQLGTILVFLSAGAANAGIYFISFSIVTGISIFMLVLSTIAYPTISSMKDGRKRATWRLIKISMIMTLPLSNVIIFYSSDVLQIFGSGYTDGSSTLRILLLSILPTTILTGIGVLAYSYSNNRQFLVIGLSTSIPRILLYFVFVPYFGADGAALTYLIGSIVGFIISIIIANKMGLKIFWRQIILISFLSTLIPFFLNYLNIHYIIGIGGTLILSYIAFLTLRIINIEDIEDILRILPRNIANPLLHVITKISKKLGRS